MIRTSSRLVLCSVVWLLVGCLAQLRGGGAVAADSTAATESTGTAGGESASPGPEPGAEPAGGGSNATPGCTEGSHAMTRDGTTSLKEKEQRKQEEEMLQSAVKDANEACGSKIVAVGDWASFKGQLTLHSMHVGANCGVALGAVAGLCHGSDEGKQAVRAGIATFICHAVDSEGEVRVDKAKKTVAFGTRVHDDDHSPKYMVETCLRERL